MKYVYNCRSKRFTYLHEKSIYHRPTSDPKEKSFLGFFDSEISIKDQPDKSYSTNYRISYFVKESSRQPTTSLVPGTRKMLTYVEEMGNGLHKWEPVTGRLSLLL